MLKATRKNCDEGTIPGGLSDVRGDTILDFCFGRRPLRHAEQCFGYVENCRLEHDKETEAEVELWLNYVDLPANFLQCFAKVGNGKRCRTLKAPTLRDFVFPVSFKT